MANYPADCGLWAVMCGAQISIQFRILLWLIIAASLTMLQLVDLIVVSLPAAH